MFRLTAPHLAGSWLIAIGLAFASAVPMSRTSAQEIPLGLDRYLPVPESSPLTAARVALGRRLFLDPILSRDRSLACASCHVPTNAFTDGRRVSRGVGGRDGVRNVPTLINRAYGRTFFWDGRTTSLEEQVLRPIQDSLEMGLPVAVAVERLSAIDGYVDEFTAAFDGPPSENRLAAALAAFVRTALSGGSRFDRFEGGDTTALDARERTGLRLFRGRAGCVRCHIGPNFSDEDFHNTGVAFRDGEITDVGRVAISSMPGDLGAFKTPTLRDVALTSPYMHDGSLDTLEDVVDFYDRGGRTNPQLHPAIHPLGLEPEEKRALVAFLRSLTASPDR